MNSQSKVNDFLKEIKERNLIYDCTNEEKLIKNLVDNKKIYLGIDPTAESLHLGNYLSLTFLKRAEEYGFQSVVIIGELTAQIGDPSFKTKDRQQLSPEDIKRNITKICSQVKKYCPSTEILYNSDFYKNFSISTFLSDIAINVNVNYLLAKDFLKDKLKTGITVTEFLYPLLQSYDFYFLYKHHNVAIQLGGSDQWGNITCGIEFIKRKTCDKSMTVGLTFPLLMDENNKKFGKSEGNALFLDPQLTKPYLLYQYVLNVSDEIVIDYLKYLTFISLEEIEKISTIHKENPHKKHAQKTLAFSLVLNIHSEEIALTLKNISEKLFKNDLSLEKQDFDALIDCIPTFKTSNKNINIDEALRSLGFSTSSSETKRLIGSGCVFCGSEKINNNLYVLEEEKSTNKCFLIKKGKKEFGIVLFN